ncbi:MAG: hypothetical protein ACFFF9_05570 [Candidatus Thorarchaeota archaeon]
MSMSDDRFSIVCPNCNARYLYSSANLNSEGQVCCQNCGRWIIAEGQVFSVVPEPTPEEKYVPYEQRTEDTAIVIAKLWVHGFVFSLLSSLIALIFVFLSVFLVFGGGIVGLILSLVVLAVMLGGANIGLASAIWGLKLKSDAQSVLGQGGIVLVIILVIGMMLLPLSFFASLILLIVDLTVLPILYGYIFRAIALNFQIVGIDTIEHMSSEYRSEKCPNCGAKYAYALSSRDEQGQVKCQNCSKEFVLEVGPDLM